MRSETMTPLPERCCGRCTFWTRANPDDLTAPEGKCEQPVACAQFWPYTLQRDLCGTFLSQADADRQADRIAEEEARETAQANSQFGVGA